MASGRPSCCGQDARVAQQRGTHQLEIRHKLGGAVVVMARSVRGVRGQAGAGVGQLGEDAAELEPVHLLGVHATEPFRDVGAESVEVLGQAHREVKRDRAQPARGGEFTDQFLHHVLDGADAVLVLDQQDVAGHSGRDVRVAVPVAPDPGAEREWARRRRDGDAELAQDRGQIGQNSGHGLDREVAEVVDRVSGLVPRIRPGQP